VVTEAVSAVIPARNEAERVSDVVTQTLSYVDEVLVVDDASTDDTSGDAKAAGARVLRNETNLGYIASIKRGFNEASYGIVVTLDADGEHDPKDIPALVAPIIGGDADLVFGARDRVPRASERLINRLVRGRAGGITDTGTGFRALRRSLALELELDGRCTCGILALEAVALGARLASVPSNTRGVGKPRRMMWGHIGQTFRVLGMLLRT
jgi:glycosyltransferase involved in cell wall biosynthesis